MPLRFSTTHFKRSSEILNSIPRVLQFWNESARFANNGLQFGRLTATSIMIKMWLKAVLSTSQSSQCHCRILGLTVTGYSYLTLLYLFREIFVFGVYNFSSLNSKPIIFDCGANIGMSVLYFKLKYPDSVIYAFEPNPESVALLEKNIAQNRLAGVTIFNCGLLDRNGASLLHLGDERGSVHAGVFARAEVNRSVSISFKRLSEYIMALENIDLIKIDVEGAEHAIVKDLINTNTLRKSLRYIIEYHHFPPPSPQYFASFLAVFERNRFNYNISTVFTKNGSFQDVMIYLERA
jgi:FkbM family methyltransferase